MGNSLVRRVMISVGFKGFVFFRLGSARRGRGMRAGAVYIRPWGAKRSHKNLFSANLNVGSTKGGYSERTVNIFSVYIISAIRRWLPPLAVGSAAVCSSGRASGACRVDVIGSGGAGWELAARQLDLELASRAWASRCSSVLVDASERRAVLTFTTRDGRSVQRQIEEPIELIPTVQSLSMEAPTPIGRPPSARSSPREQQTDTAQRLESAPRASDPYAITPLYGAQVGVRRGADHLISPCVGAFAAVPVGHWELGILGRYEGYYLSTLGGNDGAPKTSSLAFGVTAGHRAPVGPFVVRVGVTGLLAAVREDARKADHGRAEGRVGGFFGGVWPARASLRLRADLALEVVPYSIDRSQTNVTGASSLPWWGITTAVGVELQ